MATVNSLVYSLPTVPAVKWLATQERNINRELPYTDSATETPEEYVLRTYLQFLWLPQSIMPLQLLLPALLRVAHSSPSTSQTPSAHPLHSLLQPILLTSRASSQKYHNRISQLLAEEAEPADAEEEYMWFAYQKDKTGDAEPREGEDEDEAHERLKHAWLERMERREVQIQIVLHFLLLTLPGPGASSDAAQTQEEPTRALPLPPPLSPSKPKKRRRRERGKPLAPPLAPAPLEERLESYMDKLAMWQLMRSVDSTLGRAPTGGVSAGTGLGGGQDKDERDWMQAFCEDLVEPLFKEKLPELCALFRSKLFPDSAASDADTVDLSPPASPKPVKKKLKSSASAASSSTTAGSSKGKDNTSQRSRSRSLSMSLEQEQRERSRSVSIGPGGLRKRAIVREVSMTTVFKGKDRAKSRTELARTASTLAPGPSLSRTQSQSQGSQQAASASGKEKGTHGTVLVAATPVKARTARGQSQPAETQTRLPALFAASSSRSQSQSQSRSQSQSQTQPQSRLTRVDSLDIDIDGEDDDAFTTPTKARPRARPRRIIEDAKDEGEDGGDEWTLSSPPDVLLLGAPSGSQDWDARGATTPPASSSPGDLGGFGRLAMPGNAGHSQGRILVGDTPTKAR
ncbi:DNA replication regulator SLD3-domain-containing protein [Trametes polyzona]|nr:DNA replication regulator SLD3-domain-containing protein [Trametes polyzona]